MQTTSPTLRPFTKTDYDTFAGVENVFPTINFVDDFAVIQDGCKLSLVGEQDEWSQTFPSPAVATLVGNHLLAGLDAAGDDGLQMANFSVSLGFTEATKIR